MRTEQFVAMKQIEMRNRQITELQERVLQLSEALRQLEWVKGFCPACGVVDVIPHKPDCWLAALLSQQ